MKRLVVLSLFICLYTLTFSQEFPLKSSEWYISNLGGTLAKDTYLEIINYEKDTLVLGVSARKLSNGMVFYYKNDSVFSLLKGNWGLLYDFNAMKGDTIEIAAFPTTSPSISTLHVVIDSIVNQVFSSDTIQVFHNHFVNPNFKYYDDVYMRRIGTNYFLPYLGSLFPEHNYIRCYIDSTISINNATIPCNQGNPFNVQELNNEYDLSIFPNPATNKILIETSFEGSFTIDLYNILGEKIMLSSFSGSKFEMDLSDIESGIYFIQVFSQKESTSITKKLMIE